LLSIRFSIIFFICWGFLSSCTFGPDEYTIKVKADNPEGEWEFRKFRRGALSGPGMQTKTGDMTIKSAFKDPGVAYQFAMHHLEEFCYHVTLTNETTGQSHSESICHSCYSMIVDATYFDTEEKKGFFKAKRGVPRCSDVELQDVDSFKPYPGRSYSG